MTKQKDPTPTEPVEETLEETTARLAAGKGRATPTRKEREAANLRPLVPNDRKEAQKNARAKMAVEREKARVGLAAGDERYLPIRDRGPQKKYVRDFVDARFSLGEYIIPIMFVVILATFIIPREQQILVYFVLWGAFILAVLDCIFLGMRVQRKLRAKFGESERGVKWYAAMRALQMRFLRLPKPQVKRGQYPA